MNLKCVATATGLAIGIGVAVVKVVARPPSAVTSDTTTDTVEESGEESTESAESGEGDADEFECEDPECGRTFDTEHGLAVHAGKVH